MRNEKKINGLKRLKKNVEEAEEMLIIEIENQKKIMSIVVLEKLSHITYKKMYEVTVIKKILKGETYTPNAFDFNIEEDYVYKSELIRLFKGDKCIAKEDRWYSGDGTVVRTIDDVISDWNGHVFYDKDNDKWYYKAWLEICLLNGEKRKMWFDNDKDLTDELERLTKNMEHNIIIDCYD